MFGIYFFIIVSIVAIIPITFYLMRKQKRRVVVIRTSKNNAAVKKIKNELLAKKLKIIETESINDLNGKYFSLIYLIDWKKDIVEQLKEFEINKHKFNYPFLVSDKPTKLEEVFNLSKDWEHIKRIFS